MQSINPLKSLVDSVPFNRGVTAIILFAAGLVGLETYPGLLEAHGTLLKQLNQLVLILFVLELLLRFGAEWPHPLRFFRGWNLFDLAIVVLSLLPGLGEYAVAARLLRLLRVLRLIRTLPDLQVILGALLRSIPSIGYVLVLLLLLLYVYAVAGVFLFGSNDPFHFGNLHKALLTLFSILTLEGWVEVFRIQYFGCGRFALPEPELCTAPQAQPLVATAYMLSFVLLGTLIFLNLLVGIVVNSMDEMRKTLRQPPTESEEVSEAVEERLREALALLQRLKQG
ncbi:MAG: ion transporter [Meiothermus sp.]|uniref:ion transporter n=1 Tax=Meiothermus sp. TaxID=1955249 RepID=UPI0025E83162|nr:ion transporter [Meiothermus sp.]MCS7058101.1 ion transporter [Meiothermus sp.]MCS7193743.1 ion transporter [Meiothermus sp.]MCX7740780.1 ion transporter [Meiothermus sp.]MDW8090103.1 ion transporter [Meiothermus sp.]MDW8481407.1 ion transporter [Meiothermus sp.]